MLAAQGRSQPQSKAGYTFSIYQPTFAMVNYWHAGSYVYSLLRVSYACLLLNNCYLKSAQQDYASVTLCDVQLKHELFYKLYRLYFTYHL